MSRCKYLRSAFVAILLKRNFFNHRSVTVLLFSVAN